MNPYGLYGGNQGFGRVDQLQVNALAGNRGNQSNESVQQQMQLLQMRQLQMQQMQMGGVPNMLYMQPNNAFAINAMNGMDPTQPINKLMYPEPSARYCKPSRFVASVDSKPLKVLRYPVEAQYTMNKRECEKLTPEEKTTPVLVPVRIMGTPHPENIYAVAKDVCLLIHTRKGNVAKAVGQFDKTEKARMRVISA